MSRAPRWWESGEQSVDSELARFSDDGLEFALDQQVFDDTGTVVLRGELRYGEERCAASVVYPPAYLAGEHPEVYAPGLPIVSEHKREEDGLLCLDHRSFGEWAPMSGAEAVERAERLWKLTLEDPGALQAQSVDLPTVRTEAYTYEPGSAIFMLGAEPGGAAEGWLSLGVRQLVPFRGSVRTFGSGLEVPPDSGLPLVRAPARLEGSGPLLGFWRRVETAPSGFTAEAVLSWAGAEHADLLAKARESAGWWRGIERQPGPAIVAFVYEDEGPRSGETHDAWLFMVVHPDGSAGLVRTHAMAQEGLWTRQPQLEGLGEQRVAVIGNGALGSQIAELLGRAGIGHFFFVDPDIITPGILSRHSADLTDVGEWKVASLASKLSLINPFVQVESRTWALGRALNLEDFALAQQVEDEICERLADVDLIVDATAESSIGSHLAALADLNAKPAVSVAVSPGGWGARIVLQRPGRSGCLECLARHQEEPLPESSAIPQWSEDPDAEETFERGCAQPTFTAPGFEVTSAAAAAARCAVQLLLDGEGYPSPDFDLVTLRFRNADSAQPEAEYTALPRHPACLACNG